MKIKLPKEKIKRKYNATYRLRKKIGSEYFPQSSKKIKTIDDGESLNIPEVKILLQEFGFILEKGLF
jgi:hypothetical protein